MYLAIGRPRTTSIARERPTIRMAWTHKQAEIERIGNLKHFLHRHLGSASRSPHHHPSQARIYRFALQSQDAKDAFVDTAQGFNTYETLQRLDA